MAYDPPPGTIPAKIIAHLRSLPAGTKLRHAELVESLGLELGPNSSLHNYLVAAIKHGALVQERDQDDLRRVVWSLGDGVPLPAQKDDDHDLPEHQRKDSGPKPPRIDQMIAASAPAVKSAVAKMTQRTRSKVLLTPETSQGTEAEPVTASHDAETVGICCGEFKTCTTPCTPRGAHLAARGLPLYPIDAATAAEIAKINPAQIIGRTTTRLELEAPGYDMLASVLCRAFAQAASGKGAERHSSGEPFEQQPICSINRVLGSIDGALYQVSKKGHEARRLPRDRAVAELLGAINYLAACVILVEEGILDT